MKELRSLPAQSVSSGHRAVTWRVRGKPRQPVESRILNNQAAAAAVQHYVYIQQQSFSLIPFLSKTFDVSSLNIKMFKMHNWELTARI